jgi:uncharacterized protein YjcR
MKTENNNEVKLKPYNLSELANMYGVDRRTFRRWIAEYKDEIGEKKGIFFSIPQVKIIFSKLHIPGQISQAA